MTQEGTDSNGFDEYYLYVSNIPNFQTYVNLQYLDSFESTLMSYRGTDSEMVFNYDFNSHQDATISVDSGAITAYFDYWNVGDADGCDNVQLWKDDEIVDYTWWEEEEQPTCTVHESVE